MATHPNMRIAYVSGRSRTQIEKAIAAYDLPEPDYAVGDSGASVYHLIGGRWLNSALWQETCRRPSTDSGWGAVGGQTRQLQAIRFLMTQAHFDSSRTVFAGASRADVDTLSSGLPGVIVRNADAGIVNAVRVALLQRGLAQRFYVAKGGYLEMNGNYAAGVLEGLVHFLPQTGSWLEMAHASWHAARPRAGEWRVR
jgi:hypothetical protein